MRDQLVIHFPHIQATEKLSWLRLSDNLALSSVEHGSLADVVKLVNGAQVIVLIPSSDVLFAHVNIPTQNKQRMLKAIPFALEEDLASDVEDLHFALGTADVEGNIPVAIIEHDIMQQWQAVFKTVGLSVDILIPDLYAIPNEAQTWQVVLNENTALVRIGQYEGFSSETENLGITLPLSLKNNEHARPQQIKIWQQGDTSDLVPWTSNDIPSETHHLTHGLLELVNKESFVAEKTINLLQGTYSRREQLGKYVRPWALAASLLGVWFVMQIVVTVIANSELEAQSLALKTEAEKIYRQTFPEAKKVIKPKAQMQAKLKALKEQGGGKEISFLSLLADSGKAFKETPGIVLRSVRYKNGALDVEVDVANLQALDQLKQKLASNNSMSVEIQSAASRNNKVQGRLHIKGQS